MRVKQKIILILLTFLLAAVNSNGLAKDQFSSSPKDHNGKKWRIGYYEGGKFGNYYSYLVATVRGLSQLGWIENIDIPEKNFKGSAALWQWLSGNVSSSYIEFVGDAFYTANWDNDIRNKVREEIVSRLNKTKDIDLMIAMGTWAGKDLANNEHATPTIVMSTSDPIKSDIIKSLTDSGFEHVHARVDPLRYERQVQIFHDIIGFKKLGVAYEDSIDGRRYAAIDLIEKVAQERNFEIVRCFTQSDIADQNQAGKSVLQCFDQLVAKADAIYVTMQGGVNAKTVPQLAQIANKNRIPTFSQLGAEEVKKGILLSISRAGYKPVGLFHAAIIAKIFNGAKPRQLNQLFEEAPNIAINLKTAEIIGLYLYADVLAAADEIYREIKIED